MLLTFGDDEGLDKYKRTRRENLPGAGGVVESAAGADRSTARTAPPMARVRCGAMAVQCGCPAGRVARMKRPNLFILGAPKCGTTALAKWLSAHPQVFVSPVKEPHYFSEEHRQTPTLKAYESLFTGADPHLHRWVCEASVWHLYCDSAVPNILRYAPDARFIVMVRNPLEMAPSMHGQARWGRNELVSDFAEALALSERRQRGEQVGIRATPTRSGLLAQRLAYQHSCALGWQVERLFERVARERIHVVVFDDLQASPQRMFAEVQSFLGLDPFMPESFRKINAAKVRRSPLLAAMLRQAGLLKSNLGIRRNLGLLSGLGLYRLSYKEIERPPLPAALQRQMAAAYAEDVNCLGKLLGRDLGHWLDAAETREA